ncbi:hypothetical protein B0H14DRAFT_3521128 [Mycena olivaceomarginata]|nr:hypothetical protein B0H14DRAFT_3521128 [Mycena olivaceomarginata]
MPQTSQTPSTPNSEADTSKNKDESSKTPKKTPTKAQRKRQHEANRESSARYRERHREELRVIERKRAADRRAHLKTLEPGDKTLEAACACAREHCRHYRIDNQKSLALKQRQARKKAFIEKHEAQEFFEACSGCLPRERYGRHIRVDIVVLDLMIRCPTWIARSMCDGFTDARHKGFKKCAEAERWWADLCAQEHQGGCPAFEPVTFTLDPPANTHPSSAPCTVPILGLPPRVPIVGSIASANDPTSGVLPMPAGSPFTSSTTSTLSASSVSSGSTFSGSASFMKSPTPKEEPASPQLHLNARGDVLVAEREGHCAAQPSATANPRAAKQVEHATPRAAPQEPRPSVLITPVAADANTALIPAAPATPAPAPRQYAIRGVAVFYHSHGAALVAARSLNRPTAKIMVSDNIEKLEAWMFGKPFVGEDEDA